MTKKVFVITVTAHAVVIGGLVLSSVIKQWIKKEPEPEIVTWVQMQPVMEEPVIQEPVVKDPVFEPEPPPVVPEPPKPPLVQDTPPEPPLKPKSKLKKPNEIQISKKKVQRKPEAKPRPRPTPKAVVRPPTAEEIKRSLAAQVPVKQTQRTITSRGEPDMSFFYAMVKEKMYGAWQQPRGLSSSLSAEVRIRVDRNGTVTRRTLVRSSGHALMDQSVLKAAGNVRNIVALPAGFTDAFKDVTVEFEIQDAQ